MPDTCMGPRGWSTRLSVPVRSNRGSLLIEAVVAVMVLTLVGTATLTGISTIHTFRAQHESQALAENIARNQMEYVFSLPYQDPPSEYPTAPVSPGYGVMTRAEEEVVADTDIERIVVTVTHHGLDILTLETIRAK